MMKKFLSIAIVSALLSSSSMAAPFQIVGTKPLGVGGAYVAVADGVNAQYWNPGALGVTTGSGFAIPVNASFEATGDLLQKIQAIAESVDTIKALKAKKTDKVSSLTLDEVKDYNKAFKDILDLNTTGTGAIIQAYGGLQTRFGRFAMSFNQYADAGMLPIIDTKLNLNNLSGTDGINLGGTSDPLASGVTTADRDKLKSVIDTLQSKFNLALGDTSESVATKIINDAAASGKTGEQISALIDDTAKLRDQYQQYLTGGGTGDFAQNNTRVNMTGAALSELSLGYGHTLPINPSHGTLAFGGNVKAIMGEVGFVSLNLVEGEDTTLSNALQDAKKNTEVSIQPAVDAGLLYRFPLQHRLQLGLLGRNLNSPTFATPQTRKSAGYGNYQQKAQVRTGVAFWPMKRWMFSADVDLTDNNTTIPGYTSQTWGAGTEFKLWLLDLRAGLLKNFAANAPLTYTGGFGLNIGAFKVDAGAAMSSQTVKMKTDGQEVPSSFQASLSIGLVFGLGQDRNAPKSAAKDAPTSKTPDKDVLPQ